MVSELDYKLIIPENSIISKQDKNRRLERKENIELLQKLKMRN